MRLLAFATATSAPSPRWRPTQKALTEPLSDCSTLPPRIGSANTNSVRAIGPWVRSRGADGMGAPAGADSLGPAACARRGFDSGDAQSPEFAPLSAMDSGEWLCSSAG